MVTDAEWWQGEVVRYQRDVARLIEDRSDLLLRLGHLDQENEMLKLQRDAARARVRHLTNSARTRARSSGRG